MESRVVPATSETITRSWPNSALVKDDLPTLGRPMIATWMVSSSSTLVPIKGKCLTVSSNKSPRFIKFFAEMPIGSPSPKL